MHIRILTSCTGEKTVQCSRPLTQDDFRRGAEHLSRRSGELAAFSRPARDLYAGRQHLHLMRAVEEVRSSKVTCQVEVSILSAGYGLVSEEQVLAPYDVTFAGQSKREIREWADWLGIPQAVRQWMHGRGDVNLVLLGDRYLEAARFNKAWTFAAPTLLFCGTVAARTLPDWPNVRKVALSRADAKRFRQGLVWLKGYLAGRILRQLCEREGVADRLCDPSFDILGALAGPSEQLSLLAK